MGRESSGIDLAKEVNRVGENCAEIRARLFVSWAQWTAVYFSQDNLVGNIVRSLWT